MADTGAFSVTAYEREAVIEEVRRAFVHDQIDIETLERRLARALAAASPPELLALVADSDAQGWMKTFDVGPRTFAHRRFQQGHRFEGEMDELFLELVLHVVPRLVADGYLVAHCDEPMLIILKRRKPSVFGLQLGSSSQLEIWLASTGRDTLLVVRGNAPARVRQALWQLTKEPPSHRQESP
jgi:Domain of unknown function (DUF1707)